MNDNVVARPCWTVLADKAEDQVAAIQNELGLARKRLESLQSSQQRVQAMYDEYREKINSQSTFDHLAPRWRRGWNRSDHRLDGQQGVQLCFA